MNATHDAGAPLEVGEARRRREAAPAGPLRGPWRLAQLHGSGNQNRLPKNGAQVRFESPLVVLLWFFEFVLFSLSVLRMKIVVEPLLLLYIALGFLDIDNYVRETCSSSLNRSSR